LYQPEEPELGNHLRAEPLVLGQAKTLVNNTSEGRTMARNLNSAGKLVLSDLSMEEKTEIILEIWDFLGNVNYAFYKEFDGDYFNQDDEDNEDFEEARRDPELDHIWTNKRGNSSVVTISGMDFLVWGTAYLPQYIASDEDWDAEVWGWLVSKTPRKDAFGHYRDFYAKSDPENPNLPLSESEKQFGWSNEPFAWTRAYVKCPFCEPLDDQEPVDCPVNEPKLDHLSEEHEYSQSFSESDGF